ncbi:hypothetical protein BaRGS_00031058, partial [Batillaria attramentaria]
TLSAPLPYTVVSLNWASAFKDGLGPLASTGRAQHRPSRSGTIIHENTFTPIASCGISVSGIPEGLGKLRERFELMRCDRRVTTVSRCS